MLLVDILIEVLEKHGINKTIVSDEVAQAISSEVAVKLQDDDKYTIWSTEAKELLGHSLEELKKTKKFFMVLKSQEKDLKVIELGNLIFKIEELLIKH